MLREYLGPRKSHGWRSLVGCSPWGREESDRTEQPHFHFSLSCIGEGNGNPLQCSCLENPRDGGAWWAVVYGVGQSWTRLKRLSSSSSSRESNAGRVNGWMVGGNSILKARGSHWIILNVIVIVVILVGEHFGNSEECSRTGEIEEVKRLGNWHKTLWSNER